jgi:hypothetical protein
MGDDSELTSEHSSPESFLVNHSDRVEIQNPSWDDVPPLTADEKSALRGEIPVSIPGTLRNGAGRRLELIQHLCYEYVRFRRAGCSPSHSYRHARAFTGESCGVTKQTLSEHISNLDVAESATLTDHLEDVFHSYVKSLSETTQPLIETCHTIGDAMAAIAEIDNAPPITPREISYSDVYQDRPGERDSVFSIDDETPNTLGMRLAREAAIQEPSRQHRASELENQREGSQNALSDDTRVYTRDITTYETGYSRVMRKIARAVQPDMTLWGRQKLGPNIGGSGNDNAAIRAVVPYPAVCNAAAEQFAWFTVQYWEKGTSRLSMRTYPLGEPFEPEDPRLSGPIEAISKPGIHTLLGYTIAIAEQETFIQDEQPLTD